MSSIAAGAGHNTLSFPRAAAKASFAAFSARLTVARVIHDLNMPGQLQMKSLGPSQDVV